MKRRHDIVEVTVEVRHETQKAVLVKNLKNLEVWLPKSQIELEYDEVKKVHIIQLPEWLANEKELI